MTEHPVNGYQSEVNGYNITNTKIKGESVVVPKENTSQKGDVGELTTKESDQKHHYFLIPGEQSEGISFICWRYFTFSIRRIYIYSKKLNN